MPLSVALDPGPLVSGLAERLQEAFSDALVEFEDRMGFMIDERATDAVDSIHEYAPFVATVLYAVVTAAIFTNVVVYFALVGVWRCVCGGSCCGAGCSCGGC